MKATTVAAIGFSVLSGFVMAFQFALALGMPWGSFTMGGSFPGALPPAMRIAAVFQAVLLGLMSAVVLSRAGLVLRRWPRPSVWLTWAVVAFCAVAVVLNALTPSAGERSLWLPVGLAMLACSLTVAIAAK